MNSRGLLFHIFLFQKLRDGLPPGKLAESLPFSDNRTVLMDEHFGYLGPGVVVGTHGKP